jgi:hypothetical protein
MDSSQHARFNHGFGCEKLARVTQLKADARPDSVVSPPFASPAVFQSEAVVKDKMLARLAANGLLPVLSRVAANRNHVNARLASILPKSLYGDVTAVPFAYSRRRAGATADGRDLGGVDALMARMRRPQP